MFIPCVKHNRFLDIISLKHGHEYYLCSIKKDIDCLNTEHFLSCAYLISLVTYIIFIEIMCKVYILRFRR